MNWDCGGLAEQETTRLSEPPPESVNGNGLPVPPFPQFPAGRLQDDKGAYDSYNLRRSIRSWLVPYVKSRWHGNELRPILSYLFTDYKCNLDCQYCWAHNNKQKGMTEETARHSVDWLHQTGCRVLAIMGGEPLIRPGFIHKLIHYAVGKGFFVYLPTNGRLMRPEVIDRLGDAGISVWNLAMDCVRERPGLPKALEPIRPYFDHLVRGQRRHGYMVFLNINICRHNIEDVKELTEIARSNGVATDYHINEAPMLDQGHFRHFEQNETYIRPEDFPVIDDLLDYLSEKNRQGYKMINSRKHFGDMKEFLRGRVEPWECRAGQNSLIIRTDGTLAPCFTLYSADHDWGSIENPRFDFAALDERKKDCTLHCLSTCQHTLGYCYNNRRVLKWLGRQAMRGFRGVSGSF